MNQKCYTRARTPRFAGAAAESAARSAAASGPRSALRQPGQAHGFDDAFALYEEFKHRIKMQTVLSCAETAAKWF
jgi:hypothetical protein